MPVDGDDDLEGAVGGGAGGDRGGPGGVSSQSKPSLGQHRVYC